MTRDVHDSAGQANDPTGKLIAALESGSVACLFAMVVLVALVKQVGSHFGGLPVGWADDAISALLLWLVMVGSAVAAGRLGHYRVRVIESLFPTGVAVVLMRLSFLTAAVVSLVLAWYGLRAVLLELEFGRVVLDRVPLWAIYVIVPAAFAVMAARFLAFGLAPSPVFRLREDKGSGR